MISLTYGILKIKRNELIYKNKEKQVGGIHLQKQKKVGGRDTFTKSEKSRWEGYIRHLGLTYTHYYI